MAKDLNISILLDFYGDMLTEKQKEVVELYYNEDLSLSEIAEHSGITRQGVRDSIKRAEMQLLEYEERLALAQKFRSIQEGLDSIIKLSKEISYYNGVHSGPKEIDLYTSKIAGIAQSLND